MPTIGKRIAKKIIYLSSNSYRNKKNKALLERLGVDILFCPFSAPTYSEPGVPTVCTFYDLQYKIYPEFFSQEDVAGRDQTFINMCRKADHIAAISDYSRDMAIGYGGLDPNNISTIYLRMGARFERDGGGETLRRQDVLGRYGLLSGEYLIYPANFWQHKNHEMLLTAFGLLRRELGDGQPSPKLVLTGAPCERSEWLGRAAEAMGLGGSVILPGYLDDADLAILIGESRGMVFPSLFEGFGLPVIEAMALGVPVACSDTTSLPEVAGKAALLFDPRDPDAIARAMGRIWSDADLRADLVAAGRERAAVFMDTDRMADEYWAAFEHVMARRVLRDRVEGVHGDGWAGPRLGIQVQANEGNEALDLNLAPPPWLPKRSVRLTILRNGVVWRRRVTLARGQPSKLSLPLSSEAVFYEVVFKDVFTPSAIGLGEDARQLSVPVVDCALLRRGASPLSLIQ